MVKLVDVLDDLLLATLSQYIPGLYSFRFGKYKVKRNSIGNFTLQVHQPSVWFQKYATLLKITRLCLSVVICVVMCLL